MRPVKGVLPIALRAREQGTTGLMVPADNAAEAAVVSGLQIIPVQSLREAVGLLEGEIKLSPWPWTWRASSSEPRRRRWILPA